MVKVMYLAIRTFNISLLHPCATQAIPWPLKPFKLRVVHIFQSTKRFMGEVNKQRRNFLSLSELGCGSQEFNSKRAVMFLSLPWGFWFCRDSCGPPYVYVLIWSKHLAKPCYLLLGIRLFEDEDFDPTDAMVALALQHNRQHIDIYSCSWGPEDTGWSMQGPEKLTRDQLEEGTKIVSLLCS